MLNRRLPKVPLRAVLGVVILAVMFTFTVRVWIGATQARQAVEVLKTLAVASSRLRTGDVEDSGHLLLQLDAAASDLKRARANMTPAVQVAFMGSWLPGVGDTLRSLDDMLVFAENSVSMTRLLLASVSAVVDDGGGRVALLAADGQLNTAVFERLEQTVPTLLEARSNAREAARLLQVLDGRDLPAEYIRAVEVARTAVLEVARRVEILAFVATDWRDILGFNSPASYLVAALNADELRGGGGFIPGYWELTLAQGKIASVQFTDSYAVGSQDADPPFPPVEMLQSMFAGGWFAPDAAWYPDFELSARAMTQLYTLGKGPREFDGVLAIDQWGLKALMEPLGPIEVGDRGTLDSANVIESLEVGTDDLGRQYLDQVMKAVLLRLESHGSASFFMDLLLAVHNSLEERHLQVYLEDASMRTALLAAGYGSVTGPDSGGDYLLVADSNVGFSKVNRNINREIVYGVDLTDPTRPRASLDVRYANSGSGEVGGQCDVQDAQRAGHEYPDAKVGCYWNLLRVYAPADSHVLGASPLPMPEGALYRVRGYDDVEDTFRSYSESHRKVLSGFFNVDVSESETVSFAYWLPNSVVDVRGDRIDYHLVVAKQPGIRQDSVTVRIRIPKGYGLERSVPTPREMSDGTAVFVVSQKTDFALDLVLREDLIDGGIKAAIDGLGDSSVSAAVDVRIQGELPPPELEEVRVIPSTTVLRSGETVLMQAVPLDAERRRIGSVSVEWVMADPSAGAIDPTGLFHAGPVEGTYPDAIAVKASSVGAVGPRTAVAYATVTVVGPAAVTLERVIPYPAEVTVRGGRTVPLRALGWTSENRLALDVDITWEVVDPQAGELIASGFFIAGPRPDYYPDALRAIGEQVTLDGLVRREAHVSVTVTPRGSDDQIERVLVIPGWVMLRPGDEFQFAARALDARGRTVVNVGLEWVLDDPAVGTLGDAGQLRASETDTSVEGILRVRATDPLAGPGSNVEAVAVVRVEPLLPPRRVARVRVLPSPIRVRPGQKVVLTALSYGPDDRFVAETTQNWDLLDPRAGRVTDFGVFIGGARPGRYEDAIAVTVTQTLDDETVMVEERVPVVIGGDPVALVVTGMPPTVARGESVPLWATAVDEEGRIIQGVLVKWVMNDPAAGSITIDGVFRAGDVEGEFPGAITAYVAGGSVR